MESIESPSTDSCGHCGSMNTASITKARYFLLFVNDYRRKMWLYFLQLKPEVFNEFKKFKTLVRLSDYLS